MMQQQLHLQQQQQPLQHNLDPQQYVSELRPYDVLFGRGSGPNDHEGNIRFRQLVAERKPEYMATNHRMTKAKIAKEIVDQVFSVQGRFLKKVEAAELRQLGLVDGTDVWEVVGDDTIMEKAKQALRQNTQKAVSPKSGHKTPDPSGSKSPRQSRSPIRAKLSPTRAPGPPQAPAIVDLQQFEPLPIEAMSSQIAGRNVSNYGGIPTLPQQHPMGPSDPALMPPPQHRQQQQTWSGDQMNNINSLAAVNPDMVSSQLVGQSESLAGGGQFQQHQQYNPSMSSSQIPSELRDSMSMSELARFNNRRISVEMSEVKGMMDSFNKLSTGPSGSGRNPSRSDPLRGSASSIGSRGDRMQFSVHTSADTVGTMGTIEQTGDGDMSIGTMGSSMFSFYRGTESLAGDSTFGDNTEGNDDGGYEASGLGTGMASSTNWPAARTSSGGDSHKPSNAASTGRGGRELSVGTFAIGSLPTTSSSSIPFTDVWGSGTSGGSAGASTDMSIPLKSSFSSVGGMDFGGGGLASLRGSAVSTVSSLRDSGMSIKGLDEVSLTDLGGSATNLLKETFGDDEQPSGVPSSSPLDQSSNEKKS